jgi:hypothetical protein
MRFMIGGVVFAVCLAAGHAGADQLAVPLHPVVVTGPTINIPSQSISHSGLIAVRTEHAVTWQDLAAGTPPTLFAGEFQPILGGQPGDTWNPPILPVFTGDGHLAGLGSTGNGGAAVTYGRPGLFHTVARTGASAGGGYVYSQYLGFPVMNPTGQLAFLDNHQALFRSTQGGAAVRVFGDGDQAAGTNGATYHGFGAVGVNGSGRMAFDAEFTLGVGDATQNNNAALYTSTRLGSATLIARKGDLMENGLHLDTFGLPGFNDTGRLVATVGFREPEFTRAGVITSDGSGTLGTVHVLAEQFQRGPGMNEHESWQGDAPIFYRSVINGAGQIAFAGRIEDNITFARGSGIWRGTNGSDLTLVVRDGQVAPGLGAGITFAGLGGGIYTNANGDILFGAGIQGPGVTLQNNIVLYAYTPDAGLVPLLRTGMMLETSPGQLGQVRNLSTSNGGEDGSGGQDGLPMYLNDRREFIVQVGLIDGRQAIYTGTIPAPGATVLLGGAALLVARRRARVNG